MSRAGRWKASVDPRITRELRYYVPAESRFSLPSVEKHMRDRGMFSEEAREIVRHFVFDVCVQAPWPCARLQHIPKSDAGELVTINSFLIDELRTSGKELSHNRPERVPRMRVVLASIEGESPGH